MMRSRAKWWIGAWLFLATALARASTLQAIEYYNAALDHYFVTSFADEIAKLDAGVFVGWQRTGQQFTVFDPATSVDGASQVCRFYGLPSAGLDSHFYSASPAECAAVLQRFPGVWIEETANAFGVFLPDAVTGQCPSGSVPIYRAWNDRVDSNHRFTTDPATFQAMLAKGYIGEGYGPPSMPVAMCSPAANSGGLSAPECVASASTATPFVGSNVTLTASCTNAPAAYRWTNCMSAEAQCTATSLSLGSVTYSVVATNAVGASVPASVAVTWQPVPAIPKCTLASTTQTDPPTIGTAAALEVTCDSVVGNYAWSGCTSTTDTCIARESTPGPHTYSVIARSAGGSSAPTAVTLDWVASPPSPPGLCGTFPSYLVSDIGSNSVRVESVLMPNPPAFAWNGAWAVSFVVPPTMSASSVGRVSSVEFAGPVTIRQATISRTPCDFRPTDPSGVNGPVAETSGNANTIQFVTVSRPGFPALNAGGTYYYNVRNYNPSTNTITCPSSPGRCDALVEAVLPTH